MEQNENEPDCIVCEKESRLDGILDDQGKGIHRDADNGHCHNGKHSACQLGVIIGSLKTCFFSKINLKKLKDIS